MKEPEKRPGTLAGTPKLIDASSHERADALTEECPEMKTTARLIPLEALLKGLERFFIHETLKRLEPQEKERSPHE